MKWRRQRPVCRWRGNGPSRKSVRLLMCARAAAARGTASARVYRNGSDVTDIKSILWCSVRCAERQTLPNTVSKLVPITAALKTDPHSNTGFKKKEFPGAVTFKYDPQIKAKPKQKRLGLFLRGTETVAFHFSYATTSIKVWEDPAFPSVNNYECSQDLVPQGALNDIHKGWNNQDTIWCFHCEPKFQSSPSPLKSQTFWNIPHIHSFTGWHTSSHLHERQFPASSFQNLPEYHIKPWHKSPPYIPFFLVFNMKTTVSTSDQ